jgi:Tannase and feruloyl esterase
LKTKALTTAYYGRPAKWSYFDGFSTGGRQGHKLAQAFPGDYDGILAGAPAFNWSKFITNELYPQLVYLRDLNGVPLTIAQLNLLGNAAINACDTAGGVHLGYIPDPSTCRYDPTADASVLCVANGGTNATADCVTPTQALAMNKLWYGQTDDGSVPSPAVDNSWNVNPNTSLLQRWFGLTRGTSFGGLGGSNAGAVAPFTIATDQVALELQNPTLATPSFQNATGNGANGWKNLSYFELSNAFDRGVALQGPFANINTDNADLSAFRDRNGKMLMYHGLADVLIAPQDSINYYERVAGALGGIAAIPNFYRFYLIPGMAHGLSNGTTNATANPPLPGNAVAGPSQIYNVLTDWVEKGIAPTRIEIATTATTAFPAVKTRPICPYPQKAVYTSGDPNTTASYACR